MTRSRSLLNRVLGSLSLLLAAFFITARCVGAQTPSPALLILEKSDNTLAIVDPASLKIVGRAPAGPDPHEVESSAGGKLAYISNYGGSDSSLHTISVVDLTAQKPLPPIDLGALYSPHGLVFAGGKLYFTAETNKVVGRYDPATQSIRVFSSNVSSGSISVIEQVSAPLPGFGPPPGAPRKTWRVTNVPAGHGSEGFDLSSNSTEIWAANAQDGTVTVIDVATKKPTQTSPIPVRGNRLKFTPDGKRVLVSGSPSGSSAANLVILDAVSHKEVRTFDLGGGSAGILIVPDGSRAFIAVSAKDKVAVANLRTLEIDGYIATGKGPDGLAWAVRK